MAIPNPLAAIVTMLLADADVTAECGTNVFGGELPRDETGSMPQKAIVVQASGGPAQNDYMRIMPQRVDIKAYGTTPTTAWGPYLAARDALRRLNGVVHSEVLMLSAKVESQPVQLREPDGLEWPFVLGSFTVLVSEVAVT